MRICRFTMLLLVGLASLGVADEPPKKNANGLPLASTPLTPDAQRAAQQLRERFAEGTEARAMLDSLVSEPSLGPDNGWFAMSKAQTRFDWNAVAKRYDQNSDGRVDSSEFRGRKEDFMRADRTADGALDAADFDWNSASSPTATAVGRLFGMTDANSNGKVTRDEFLKLFERLKGDAEYLAAEDMLDTLTAATAGSKPPEPLDRSMMIMALLNQELGAFEPGPELNQPAPDFTLPRIGGGSVTLSRAIESRPVVLVFGTFTCSPFRGQSGNIEKLHQRYRDRADFYLVYVREAHPNDGWHMQVNESKGISIAQPKSNAERHDIAQTCHQHLDISMPMLVDTIDDQAGSAYSGMPNRLVIIDAEGKIAFKNARGPFGFSTRQLEQALVMLLNEPSKPEASTGR